jgi:uncharacterized integral membrane protein
VIRGAGIAGVALVLALVMLFSRWNGAERVTLDLGVWTFYRVPLVYVAFGGIFVGMVVMLLANLHADIRVRRFLRDRLEEEGREERERIDRYQRDLFRPDPDEEELQGEEAARFGASGSTPPRGTEPATGLGQETSARPAPSADSVPPLRSDPPVGPESPVRPEPPARPGPSFPLDPPRSAEPSRGPESLSPGTPGEPGSGSVPVPPDRRGPPVT